MGQSKERVIDVRTFVPAEQIVAELPNGKKYPLISWVDLPVKDALDGLRDEETEAATPAGLAGAIERATRQIKRLCPTMPDEELAELSTRQLLGIAREFYAASQPQQAPPEGGDGNPPGAGESGVSDTSSPAPRGSTAGV